MDTKKIGALIAVLRKEQGYTQDGLAEKLNVSPQAVSKWENGHSLPETSLLPVLARALECSIDVLLNDSRLRILSAFYGDGLEKENVAARLNKLIQNDRLETEVNAVALGSSIRNSRVKYLTVKYRNDTGVFYTFSETGKILSISNRTQAVNEDALPEKAEIIAASYGAEKHHYDVMHKIEHYKPFLQNEFWANHESFPSDPASDETDYLTLVYLNKDGLNTVTCAEGESIAYSEDKRVLFRKEMKDDFFIAGVPELPLFGEGMECSWAAALTAGLLAMGVNTSYDEVMGVSGACYRLAFCSPGWDYSSVDGLVAYDYATPGYKAFGYTPKFADRVDKENRSAERAEIVRQIKCNMPVLGINLRVAAEWGVICGYKDSGEDLFCRTKYDAEIINSEDFIKGSSNPFDYLYVDNWPFIITYFSGKTVPPSAKENLTNSLKVFIDCVNMQSGGYKTGYSAYETWRTDLLDGAWYSVNNDEQLERRFSVNQFCTLALFDARKAAYNYLSKSTDLLGKEKQPLLLEIAEIFGEISEHAEEIHKMLDAGEYLSGEKARKFWTAEKRAKQADLLGKMCDLERKAEELAKGLIY